MGDIGSETKVKRCHKCGWCAKYDDYDVMANTHTPVYFCQFQRGIDGKAPTPPTLDDKCPYFGERYEEEDDDES